jgi:hypothetical protein
MMKKIILSMSLIVSIISGLTAKPVLEIYIGSVSKDGTGLGPVSWDNCVPGKGVCIQEVGQISSTSVRDYDIDLNGILVLSIIGNDNIELLDKMVSNGNINFNEVSFLSKGITNEFEFLNKDEQYFIPAGIYSCQKVKNGYILTVKIKTK